MWYNPPESYELVRICYTFDLNSYVNAGRHLLGYLKLYAKDSESIQIRCIFHRVASKNFKRGGGESNLKK